LFLGRDALLQRDRDGNFEARPVGELRKVLCRAYGDDANWESHAHGVMLVATALNKGDLARAAMTAVLMRPPVPGSPSQLPPSTACSQRPRLILTSDTMNVGYRHGTEARAPHLARPIATRASNLSIPA